MSEAARWRVGITVAVLGLLIAVLAWQIPKAPQGTDSAAAGSIPTQGTQAAPAAVTPAAPEILPTQAAPETKFLADTNPLNSHSAVSRTGAFAIGGTQFPNSVELCCGDQADVIWHVSGAKFAARVGVADDAMHAFGKTIDVQFYDQNGRELNPGVVASVGNFVDVEFPIDGVVQLQIRWTTRDVQGIGVYLALGTPRTISG